MGANGLGVSDTQPDGREPGMPVSIDQLVVEPAYHNPSPLVWLIGCANEAMVEVEGVETMALLGDLVPSLHSNRRVLLQIWVKNSSTGGFVVS